MKTTHFGDETLSESEREEREGLHLLWATGRATKRQILRCTELDRKNVPSKTATFGSEHG